MRQHRAQPTVAAGTAALTLGLAALLGGCSHDPASAATSLQAVRDAQVVRADGRVVPAAADMRLHRGDAVRTGADGAAVLDTGGRLAYLGADGAYAVGSGVTAVLQRGAFVVDARRGPQLTLTVGAVTVATDRNAVRVERTFAVRVGDLAGNAVRVSTADATLSVDALHQVVVAGRSLPRRTTPLVLTDDDAERRVVPDLVLDDQQLASTAAALNQGSEARTLLAAGARAGITATSRLAAFTTSPAAGPPSETALPVAIARAAAPSAAGAAVLQARYRLALSLRAAGGSWGVVARLAGTDAAATGAAIDALLGVTVPTGTAPPGVGAGPGAAGGSGSVTAPTPGASPRPGPSTPPPTGGPSPRPSPSPSPSSAPGPLTPVEDLVGTVIGILPTPGPGGGASPAPGRCTILGLLNC